MLTINYADFRQLLRIEDPKDFAPALELRQDGVYVKPLSDLEERLIPSDSQEMLERLKHPTGNLSEPVLALPCNVDALERFVNEYAPGSIYPFDLVRVLKRRAFEQARIDAKEQENYHWPIVAGVYALQSKVQRQYELEEHDSKKVVLRAVLDDLDALLEGDLATAPENGVQGWPWGTYETKLLRKLAGAVTHFWIHYDPTDPSTAKSSKVISAWIHEQGVGKRVAEIMAQIIRVDGLRPGPR